MTPSVLSCWRDGPARQVIIDFVERVCGESGVPVEQRVAVFDNDGTLWCEKPMPIQLDFILRRFAEMAQDATKTARRQPWKAVAAQDLRLVRRPHDQHYRATTPTCGRGARNPSAYSGITVDDFEAAGRRLHA